LDVLSARTDMVPAAIALELSSLQDDVKPVPTPRSRSLTPGGPHAKRAQVHPRDQTKAIGFP
jgi:hypothetical protein